MAHIHAELIKAWADGASIQFSIHDGLGGITWVDVFNPRWTDSVSYRIKPETKPDIITKVLFDIRHDWGHVDIRVQAGSEIPAGYSHHDWKTNAVTFTIDPETKIIKKVELL